MPGELRPAPGKDSQSSVFFALSNPLRRRILSALARSPRSASSLSSELCLPHKQISYHLRDILEEECRLVEVVERVPRRGGTELIYGLRPDAFVGGLAHTDLPEPVQAYLQDVAFAEFLEALGASVVAGSAEAKPGSRLEWKSIEVDLHGWLELGSALEEFTAKLDAVADRSQRRCPSDDSDCFNAIVGLAAFEAFSGPASSGEGAG